MGRSPGRMKARSRRKAPRGPSQGRAWARGAKVGSARRRSAVPGRKRRARPKRAATPKMRSRRMERAARAFC